MPFAMLAPRRVAGMESFVLPIRIAMIFAMPSASAVALPAAMACPMIARRIAMIFAMLPPVRIGRVQVPVIPPGIAMVGPMAGIGLTVAVAGPHDVDRCVRMLRSSLNLLGALGSPGFNPCGPLGAPWCTVNFDIVGVSGVTALAFTSGFLILGDGGH